MEREIPNELQQSWDNGTKDPNPLTALNATKEFWPMWAQWQAVLAREAIANGATWDEIGRAMGTSRQAAWGRFKTTSEGSKSMETEKDKERQLKESIKEIQTRGRERDRALAADRKRLHDDLHTLDRQRSQERKERKHQIEELRASLRKRHHKISLK